MSPERNLRRVVLAHALSRTGGAAGFFVGLWGKAAFELAATPGELAILTAATGVASMVGAAAAGVLVDRWDPRRVLIRGELLFAPAVLALLLADSMLSLTLLAPLAWFALAFPITATSSFPPVLTSDDRALERANVWLEVGGSLGFVLGPAVGALVVRAANVDAVFLLDAATSLVAVGLLVPVRLAARPVADEPARGLAELRAGFRYAFTTLPLRTVLLLGTATWLSFGAFTALEPLYFRDVLGADAEVLGWVNTLFGAGTLVGMFVLQRAEGRLTSIRTVALLTIAGGIGAALYTGTDRLLVVLVAAVLWGTVLGLLLPLIRTLAHLHTRPGMVGRVMGVLVIQHNVGELLPLAIAPPLAVALGVQAPLVGTGVLLVAIGTLALPTAARVDRLRPPRGEEPAPLPVSPIGAELPGPIGPA